MHPELGTGCFPEEEVVLLLRKEFVDEQRRGGAEQGSAVPGGC